MKNKYFIICIILVLVVPILLYWYNFKEYTISTNPEHWGVFGDYIGGVYSVVLTIVLFYITYLLNKKESGFIKQSNAAKEIYNQISSINSYRINVSKVNQLKRLIDLYENILPQNIYDDLLSISDYYLEIKGHPELIDNNREDNVKKALKLLL